MSQVWSVVTVTYGNVLWTGLRKQKNPVYLVSPMGLQRHPRCNQDISLPPHSGATQPI